ncbi:hypothetical protein [Rhizobium leguminosarum]
MTITTAEDVATDENVLNIAEAADAADTRETAATTRSGVEILIPLDRL